MFPCNKPQLKMFYAIILMKNFLGVVYVRNGLKCSFQTCSVNIFYRNKIIHYDSKLNCFISSFFLKSLQRVCTKQKQEGSLYLL